MHGNGKTGITIATGVSAIFESFSGGEVVIVIPLESSRSLARRMTKSYLAN